MLASLNAETGNLIWRQVYEYTDRGKIHLLAPIIDEPNDVTSTEVRRRIDDNSILLTISGSGLVLGRAWNLRTGNLAFEWTITQTNPSTEIYWFYDQSAVYSVTPIWGSRLEVNGYSVKSGYNTFTKEIQIGGIQKNDCDFSQSFLICQTGNQVQVVNLKTGDKNTITSSKRYQLIKVSN